jgi:hypothetical protein
MIMSLFIAGAPAVGHEVTIYNALPYVLDKLRTHQIVLMGTIHRKPQILDLTARLLPQLTPVGVTHLALEVSSDQQANIDRFLQTGMGLGDIQLHHAIDCPQYRRLFTILRMLPPGDRPEVVAVDLPPSLYSGPISRDAYMADALTDLLHTRPDAKVIAIVGSLHVLKKLDWLPRVTDRQPSIRSALAYQQPALKVFSVVNLVNGASHDFRDLFAGQRVAAAVDLDERFSEWRLGVTDCLAVRDSLAHELVDGVILHR